MVDITGMWFWGGNIAELLRADIMNLWNNKIGS